MYGGCVGYYQRCIQGNERIGPADTGYGEMRIRQRQGDGGWDGTLGGDKEWKAARVEDEDDGGIWMAVHR